MMKYWRPWGGRREEGRAAETRVDRTLLETGEEAKKQAAAKTLEKEHVNEHLFVFHDDIGLVWSNFEVFNISFG